MKLENPIDKIMKTLKIDSKEKNKILFETGDELLDLRTDLIYPEEVYVSTLIYNDNFLKNKGLKPIYSLYLNNLLRKRISLNRRSRQEFVDVNKRDFMNEDLNKLGTIHNLTEVRK